MTHQSHQPDPTTSRAVHLVLVAVIALTFIGFFVGIRQGTPVPEVELPALPAPEAHPHAVPAVTYQEFDRRIHGPNRNWENILTRLQQPRIDLLEERQPGSESARRAVLAARAQRRAFDGAPPVVPHPIDQLNTASCMACHGGGLYIGRGVYAPMMSHEYMPNCTQCHVEMRSPDIESFILAINTFEGLPAQFGGHRAWDGAPPVIPHPIFMRENCMSCHGPAGSDPIRTTHPWRANCTQCHAPSAVLDQVAPADAVRLLRQLQ